MPFATHLALIAALVRLAHERTPAPVDLAMGCDYLAAIRPPSRGIFREDAERLTLAYLARFTADHSTPPEFSVFGCQNPCIRVIGTTPGCGYVDTEAVGVDEACPSWQCEVTYGDDRRTLAAVTIFTVYVGEGGRHISDDLGITRCLTKHHGCRLFLPKSVERTLLRWRTERNTRYLAWDRVRGEFVWSHVANRPAIAAHR